MESFAGSIGRSQPQPTLPQDVMDGLQIRGTLEGLAARFASQRGVSERDLAPLRACLRMMDGLLQRTTLSLDLLARYVHLNARFHAQMIELSGYPMLRHFTDSAPVSPFTVPSFLTLLRSNMDLARRILLVEQDQHRQILDAVEQGDGDRADELLREHGTAASRQLEGTASG
jgi:GntR family transcriptional regulator of vanillate catabolism